MIGNSFILPRYYVACDQNASPLVLFDTEGNIVKEIRRSPFGHVKSDSNVNFYVAVGFQGSVPDTHTGLLYLNKRWYDPFIGQWMTPNWEKLANKMTAPTDIFIYRFHNNDPINTLKSQGINYMTGKCRAKITQSQKQTTWFFLLNANNTHYKNARKEISK